MDQADDSAVLSAYFSGALSLDAAATELVRRHREHGWGLYLSPAELAPEQRAQAEALVARYGELTGAPGRWG